MKSNLKNNIKNKITSIVNSIPKLPKLPKLNKNSLLLLVLVIILSLFLIYLDVITTWFNNRNIKYKDTFNNISGYDPNQNKYKNISSFTEGFEVVNVEPKSQNTKLIDVIKNTDNSDTVMNDTVKRNYKVVVDPKTRNVKVEFLKVQPNEIENNVKEIGYLIVLAKYNTRLQKIGHVNAKITNEGLDIENYLNKYSFIFQNDTKKDPIRNLIRNVNNSTASNILELFNTEKNLDVLLTDDENTNAFFELLEMVYDMKYYDKALDIKDTTGINYNTGIFDLYNDIKLINPKYDGNKTLFDITTPRKTEINITGNVNDAKLELIKNNKLDAINIKTKLNTIESTNINSKLLDFIVKYLEKYQNLSLNDNMNISTSKSICSRNGICSYTFENLEDKDSNGNLFYYKLGFGYIYNIGTSSYIEEVSKIYTYSFGVGNRLMYFKLDNSLEEQTRLLKRLAEIEQNSILSGNDKQKQPMVNDVNDNNNDMEAYMKMLRPHIGNYPDEFTLRNQDVRDLSLADYLTKSVNRGTINIGVDIKDTAIFPETTNPEVN